MALERKSKLGVAAAVDDLQEPANGDEFADAAGGRVRSAVEFRLAPLGGGGAREAVGVQEADAEADGHAPPGLPVQDHQRLPGEVRPVQGAVPGVGGGDLYGGDAEEPGLALVDPPLADGDPGYRTHNWAEPYPGESKTYPPNDVPGACIPLSESHG